MQISCSSHGTHHPRRNQFPRVPESREAFFFLSSSLFFFFSFFTTTYVTTVQRRWRGIHAKTSFTSLLRRSPWTRRRNSAVRLICLMGLVRHDIALPKCGFLTRFPLAGRAYCWPKKFNDARCNYRGMFSLNTCEDAKTNVIAILNDHESNVYRFVHILLIMLLHTRRSESILLLYYTL